MGRPFVVPDAWKHRDWDDVCPECRQPRFLVGVAERRLPSGPCDVVRCGACQRALWYRSNANAPTVAQYHKRVVWATQQHRAKTTGRQPDHGQTGSGFRAKRTA